MLLSPSQQWEPDISITVHIFPPPGASLLPPPYPTHPGSSQSPELSFLHLRQHQRTHSRSQDIQTPWLKIAMWLAIFYFLVCWRDSLFDLTLVKHSWILFWTWPQPWPINIWTKSSKLHPWGGPNPYYSVWPWILKSAEIIYYLFQAISAEGASLSQSLGWQEPTCDNSQLTNPDGFHRDQRLPKLAAFCNFHFLNCAKVSIIPMLSILSFSLKTTFYLKQKLSSDHIGLSSLLWK